MFRFAQRNMMDGDVALTRDAVRRLVTLGLATAIVLFSVMVGDGVARPRTRPEPVAESPEMAEARSAEALMRSQPAGLQLFGDVLGWVKRCTGEPSVCTVSRGFALDPNIIPSLKTTITTTERGGVHSVAVLVPLDQDLTSGFAIRGDENDASLGSYSRCSVLGCGGDLFLTNAAYAALVSSRQMDVIVGDISGRTVMYRAPLDGLEAAINGPALSDEEFVKAMKTAGQALVSAAQARDAAARSAGSGAPASPEQPTSQPAASTDVPPSPIKEPTTSVSPETSTAAPTTSATPPGNRDDPAASPTTEGEPATGGAPTSGPAR